MHIVYHDTKNSATKIEHIFFLQFWIQLFIESFYRKKLNENRFVISIYYESRYAQFTLSSP